MNLKPLPQGSGISSVVEDTSPQLGGNLDTNGNSIDSVTPTELGYVHGVTSAIQTQINSLAHAITIQGTWDADANDPDITTTTVTGQAWIVSTAGATDLGSITDWKVGDVAVKTGTGWMKLDNTDTSIEGTTSATFQLESGSSGAQVKNSAGELQARNAADDAYADFRALSFYGDGSNLTNVGAAAVSALTIDATNKTGSALAKGVVVYVSGASGSKITIAMASNTDSAKIRVVGITAETIADNATGTVRVRGELSGIDTSGATDANPDGETWVAGDLLWLHNSSGGMTKTRPTTGRSIKCAYSLVGSNNNDTLLVIARENEVWNTCAAGEDVVFRVGDNDGANKVSVRDYANNEVASIDSDGSIIVTSISGGSA